MTKSRTIGSVRIRPQMTNGAETGKWFVDVPASLTSNGKRKRKLFDNQTQAAAVARELRKRIDPVTGLIKIKERYNSGLTLGEAVKLWAKDEQLRVDTLKKRAKTLETDIYRLRPTASYFDDRAIASISDADLAKYQAFRLKQGRKPVTINGELLILQMVFNWAVKKNFLKAAPKYEAIPVRPAEVIVPTPEEVVRIIDALPERLKPLIRFLAETGCRKGEAVNLTWDCVDEIGGYVEIKAREGWTPKTQQSERRIPIGQELLDTIRKLPKDGQYVFAGRTPDEPIGEFRKSWATAVKNAKIKRRGKLVHVPVKSLRKAHASWQAERGVTESVLQGLLGHARGSIVTRQFYVHASEEAKKAAVIELPLD